MSSLIFIVLLLCQNLHCQTMGGRGRYKVEPDLLKEVDLAVANEEKEKTWDIILEFREPRNIEIGSFQQTNVSNSSTSTPEDPYQTRKRLMEETYEIQISAIKFLGQCLELNLDKVKRFWITNTAFIPAASAAVVLGLTSDAKATFNITHIRKEIVFQVGGRYHQPQFFTGVAQSFVESRAWGVKVVNAQAWWNKTYDGTGVIVGHIDTGVDVNHPSLKDQWVGAKRMGWFDPNGGTTLPFETDRIFAHGTHTLGIILGKWTGVAPSAKWISCIACVAENCKESLVTLCSQYVFCPNPEESCTLRPQIVSNAWAISQAIVEKLQTPTFYDRIVSYWRRSGIISVFSAGNEEDGGRNRQCGSLGTPGDRLGTLAIGALRQEGTVGFGLAQYSPSGPPEQRYSENEYTTLRIWKPEFIAPASNIISTSTDGRFHTVSGTSLGAAHMAGVLALLISRNKNLLEDHGLTDVSEVLRKYSKTPNNTVQRNCGPIGTPAVPPNFEFGYGYIDLENPNSTSIDENKPEPGLPPPGPIRNDTEKAGDDDMEVACLACKKSVNIGYYVIMILLLFIGVDFTNE